MAKILIYRVNGGKWHLLGLEQFELTGEVNLKTCTRFNGVKTIPSGKIRVILHGRERMVDTRWLAESELNQWADQGRICQICDFARKNESDTKIRFKALVTTDVAAKWGIQVDSHSKSGITVRRISGRACPVCGHGDHGINEIEILGSSISACPSCLKISIEMAERAPEGTAINFSHV